MILSSGNCQMAVIDKSTLYYSNSISRSQGFPAALLEVESGAARCQRPPFCIRSASCGHPGSQSGGSPSWSLCFLRLLAGSDGQRNRSREGTSTFDRFGRLEPSVSGVVLSPTAAGLDQGFPEGRAFPSPPDLPLRLGRCAGKNTGSGPAFA